MRRALSSHIEKFVDVIKTEEKGSDVNLAVHALNDAWLNSYDCAVIVSNDSDLAESLRLIKHQFKKTIILATPGEPKLRPTTFQLKKWAKATIHITDLALKASQLPNPIPGGAIHKPSIWK
jgi:uncharacterized LabA/DUF88 family protein